ncbi:MAG: argininosuccinate lyase [Candidatus Helarchaeota archaeon]|nr:argininosuccinate lyase [Candidatus Helarchaeota archaeon]
MSKKIVRGRFKEDLDKRVEKFLSGKDIIYDSELISYDIYNNIAHHLMLHKIGALMNEDIKQILKALKEIYDEWNKGEFNLLQELEDVHMNVEHAVSERIDPEIAKKMHLARSRNDQVLTDLRLFMRDEIVKVQKQLLDLISVLIEKAKGNTETLYIGYTHTQQAQPITFAHWCMAHVDTLFRDLERLEQTYRRVNLNPLGAAAIAGTSWAIDRRYTTELLGFDGIQENTLDVVSSRGEFETDLISNFTSIMIHLGRIAEDIVLGATTEFGYINLSDKYTTGSSIMPHKKNPDVVELIRAKTAIMNGNLLKILGILKGIPSGYNRDHQELKEALFPSVKTIKGCLEVCAGLISTMELNQANIDKSIQNNVFITTTELVDLLIKEWNVPFRTAYTIIANYFKENPEKKLFALESLEKFINGAKESSKKIPIEKIQKALDPLETVKKRKHIGGPAPQEELRMIKDREQKLKNEREKILNNEEKINHVFNELMELVEKNLAD